MDDSTSRQSIEQQFARAQELGRWLTDDELAAEAEQESLRLAEVQKQKSVRTQMHGGLFLTASLALPSKRRHSTSFCMAKR